MGTGFAHLIDPPYSISAAASLADINICYKTDRMLQLIIEFNFSNDLTLHGQEVTSLRLQICGI